MTTDQAELFSLVISAIFILIGLGLVVIGVIQKQKKSRVTFMGIALSGGGIIALFVKSADFRSILVAFTAIVVGGATIWNALETRRKELREKHDQILKELLAWIERVSDCPFETNPHDPQSQKTLNGELTENESTMFSFQHIRGFQEKYRKVRWQIPYIQNIANVLSVQISKDFDQLTNELQAHENMLLSPTTETSPKFAQKIALHNRDMSALIDKVLMDISIERARITPPIV